MDTSSSSYGSNYFVSTTPRTFLLHSSTHLQWCMEGVFPFCFAREVCPQTPDEADPGMTSTKAIFAY